MRRLGHLYLSVTLISLTVFSGLFLSSSKTSANTSASASVTVAAACSLNATTDSDHSANISPGTYQSEIGSTTFTIVCNDIEGYSVYAVGYSNNEFGNNKLLANINGTLVPSYDISTGTNTSGTPSSWAMKLTPGTGLTASSILNSYNNYNVIPNQYTKIATLIPATNSSTNNTTTFKSTYAANIATTQPAGTYAGKVKYTMVHPASEVPLQPYSTQANAAGYYPNASGVVNSMGRQSIAATATSTTLWASNFKRPGYGFAGWSDKYDWVLNENDADGNGTGVNEGYHIYGPNQDITFTAGQYSGTNQGLSLYAVWVKSQGALQGWNGCSAMKVGEVTALTDLRDDDTYAVAKLADGNCWMIENLRLDHDATVGNNRFDPGVTNESLAQGYAKSITYGDFIGLAEPESPWEQASAAANSLYYSGVQTGTALINIGSTNYPNYRFPRYNNSNTANPTNSVHAQDDPIYSYGNYYSWQAAMANTRYYNYSTSTDEEGKTSDNVGTSICPKGWRLPYGGTVDKGATTGSFSFLDIQLGGTGNSTGYIGGISNYWRVYPNNFVYSGHVRVSIIGRGENGRFWSSTALNVYVDHAYANAHELYLDYNLVGPGSGGASKYVGQSVRCLVDI